MHSFRAWLATLQYQLDWFPSMLDASLVVRVAGSLAPIQCKGVICTAVAESTGACDPAASNSSGRSLAQTEAR